MLGYYKESLVVFSEFGERFQKVRPEMDSEERKKGLVKNKGKRAKPEGDENETGPYLSKI